MTKVPAIIIRKHLLVSFQVMLIILVIFSGLSVSAQSLSRAESKLERLYNKKPKRCIKYAGKLRRKGKHKALSYYYSSIANYSIYKSKKRQTYLTNSFLDLEKSKNTKFDINANGHKDRVSEIETAMIEFIGKDIEKKKYSQALKYSKKYFAIFDKQIPDYDKLNELIDLSKQKPTVEIDNSNENDPEIIKVDPAKLISDAKSVLGTKYKLGGESKAGLDCSGFNAYVFRQSGIELPHSATLQSRLGETIAKENCRPGDLIFFKSLDSKKLKVQHAGMILSNEDGKIKIIHCPNSGVMIEGEGDAGYDRYWQKRFLYIKRISSSLDVKTD